MLIVIFPACSTDSLTTFASNSKSIHSQESTQKALPLMLVQAHIAQYLDNFNPKSAASTILLFVQQVVHVCNRYFSSLSIF